MIGAEMRKPIIRLEILKKTFEMRVIVIIIIIAHLFVRHYKLYNATRHCTYFLLGHVL